MLKVEVFSSPGCGKCAQARDVLKEVVESLGTDKVSWREVNILEEMDYAVDLGIMASPSIAIDGALLLILSGLYMLNAYLMIIPELGA